MGTGHWSCLALMFVVCLITLLPRAARADHQRWYKGRSIPIKPPHMLIVEVGDLAWADVDWNFKKKDVGKSLNMRFINSMRKDGMQLDRFYTSPYPLPSTVSLYTGLYSHRLGFKAYNEAKGKEEIYYTSYNYSLSLDHKILPEYMKELGYNTHLLGRWKLGFCDWDHWPLKRGFDTFYGFLGGHGSYYDHTTGREGWYDFWNGTEKVDVRGKYTTNLITERAVKIILDHKERNDPRPLYLHMAHQVFNKPIQGPEGWDSCDYCDDLVIDTSENQHPDFEELRPVRCRMGCALDYSMEKVWQVLKENNYTDHLLIAFFGVTGGPWSNGASNGKLRGRKGTVYEGGTRVPAFIHSKALLPLKKKYKHPIHITDVLPTLLAVAGKCTENVVKKIDGNNVLDGIVTNKKGRKDYFVYHIDTARGYGAIGDGKFKLIFQDNSTSGGQCVGWKYRQTVHCNEWELYKVKGKDKSETTNLLEEGLKKWERKFKKMREAYERLAKLEGPKLPLVNITTFFEPGYTGDFLVPYRHC